MEDTTSSEKFQCNVCMKSFSKKQNLFRHERIHDTGGEKSYKYDQCGKSFSRKHDLTRHKWVHIDEKP